MATFLPHIYLGGSFGLLNMPHGWASPSLLENPAPEGLPAILTEPPHLLSEIRTGFGSHRFTEGALKFWAMPKRTPAPPADTPPADPVAEKFRRMTEEEINLFGVQLKKAKTPQDLLNVWRQAAGGLGWIPASALEDPKAAIQNLIQVLKERLERMVQAEKKLLSAHQILQEIFEHKRYPQEKNSLGALIAEAMKHERNAGWAQKIGKQKDSCKVEDIWNDPIAAAGEKMVVALREIAVQSLETFDINDLEATVAAKEIFLRLFEKGVEPGTVGEVLQNVGERAVALRARGGLIDLRIRGGTDRWDPTWREPTTTLPRIDDQYFKLEVDGEIFTIPDPPKAPDIPENISSMPVFFYMLAEGDHPFEQLKMSAARRSHDIRSTTQNMDGVAWEWLQEVLKDSTTKEETRQALRDFQEWFLIYFVSQQPKNTLGPSWQMEAEELKKNAEEILEAGGYYEGRAGQYLVRIRRSVFQNFSQIVRMNKLFSMRVPNAHRTFSADDFRKMPWIPLPDSERRWLHGLLKMVEAHPYIGVVINTFETRRRKVGGVEEALAEIVRKYEESLEAVIQNEISTIEGAMRILQLSFQIGPYPTSPIFRENFSFREQDAFIKRFVDESLYGLLILQNDPDRNAGQELPLALPGLRLYLHTLTKPLKEANAELFQEKVGDLLETGRAASPHDDRYSREEFLKILELQRWAVEQILNSSTPAWIFEQFVEAGETPFLDMNLIHLTALLDRKMAGQTRLNIRDFVMKQTGIKKWEGKHFEDSKVLRTLEASCWIEVVIQALEGFRGLMRKEGASDKNFMAALLRFFKVQNGGVVLPPLVHKQLQKFLSRNREMYIMGLGGPANFVLAPIRRHFNPNSPEFVLSQNTYRWAIAGDVRDQAMLLLWYGIGLLLSTMKQNGGIPILEGFSNFLTPPADNI